MPAPDFDDVLVEPLLERGAMDGKVDVVIPCYRAERHMPLLLKSMNAIFTATPELCNVIVVIDGDDYEPEETILAHVPENVSARAAKLSKNTGYAHASNVGTELGRAPYILLLNADVQARDDFVTPLVEALESNPEAAAAGGLILDPRGRIHSCGSEYNPASLCYDHVHRDCPADLDDPYVREPGERDMLTAAVFLVRRRDFEDAGGFDEAYVQAYFEDTDLCMKLRHAGKKILYVPASISMHECGHSGVSSHKFYAHNRDLFHRRWVETGLVYKFAEERRTSEA